MLAHRVMMVGRRAYADEVIADSPVAYWKLDETSGTTTNDAIGSNHGTYTGGYTLNQAGIPSTGRPSVALNGSSGYINCGAPAALNLTAAWTLEAWVYLTSAPNGSAVISELYTGAGDQVLYALGFGGMVVGGTSQLQVGFYTGSTWRYIQGAALSLNTWHHIAGTWDGTNLRLYADGAQVASGTPASGPVAGMNGLVLGRRWDTAGSAPYLPGRLDEVAIYDAALSATRILAHYNAGI